MKILVTGGAGFIASHIVDSYCAAGHTVAIIDSLKNGSRKNVNPKARFYKADITDERTVRRIIARERPAVINHHAAEVSVTESMREPLRVISANMEGTANLFESFLALPSGVRKKFILASTGGAIYGDAKRIPAGESTEENPASVYALSKFLAEQYLRFRSKETGCPVTILRYANIYGPRQTTTGEAGVVPIFKTLMKQGKAPTIFGDGSKTRDYVFVGDVVRANIMALKKGAGETVNIGWGAEVRDDVIYRTIADILEFKKPPRYAPVREGEVMRSALDAKKAKLILGWEPRTPLYKGLKETLLP
jgi:UDP-glucose 4-epimerase